jgi:hypothetical protein
MASSLAIGVAVAGLVVLASLAILLGPGQQPIPTQATQSASLRTPRAKAYVHIGPHKTGTSSFQKWLAEHRGLGDLLLPDGTAGATVAHRGGGSLPKPLEPRPKDIAYGCARPLCASRDGSPPPKQRCPLLTNTTELNPEGRNLIISSEAFA